MPKRRPLVVELFSGSFGWSRGWLELGGIAIGFDIDHQPYHGPVPEGAELVLQDVLTLDGRQFRDADLILASSPCQEFSWRGMPWKNSKAIVPDPLPEWWRKSEWQPPHKRNPRVEYMTRAEMEEWIAYRMAYPCPPPTLGIELFRAPQRIQREASQAAGHHIPMIQENVRAAQRWVGPAQANYGSFFLWGDVAQTEDRIIVPRRLGMRGLQKPRHGLKTNPDGSSHGGGSWFAVSDSVGRGARQQAIKNDGGSWFNVAHNTTSGHGQNPVGRLDRKQGGDWFSDSAPGTLCHESGKSTASKAASARIAMIPLALSQHVASVYFPR